MPASNDGRRTFGTVEKLPSGNFRAYYTDPEGRTVVTPAGKVRPVRHFAATTFAPHPGDPPRTAHNKARERAEAWLSDERQLIESGKWTSPEDRREAKRRAEASRLPRYSEYAKRWIEQRKVKGRPIANKTRHEYEKYLRRFLAPAFGDLHLDEITPGMVNDWYDQLCPDKGAQRAKVYTFARGVLNTAVSAHGPMPGAVNPFAIRGAGSAPYRRRDEHVLASDQEAVLLERIRPEWRLIILLATWCGLRYGEIAALRRSDVDLKSKIVRVRSSIEFVPGAEPARKGPKSDEGNRDQRMTANVLTEMKRHLRAYVTGRDGLIFPGAGGNYLHPNTFYGKATGTGWLAARAAAELPAGFRFHDLRASGATLLANEGATEAEVQKWLGDSTPAAAQRYVRASRSRMDALTDKLSTLAESGHW